MFNMGVRSFMREVTPVCWSVAKEMILDPTIYLNPSFPLPQNYLFHLHALNCSLVLGQQQSP